MNYLILAVAGSCLVLAAPVYAQAIDPHQPHNDGSRARSAAVAPGAVAKPLDPATTRLNAAIVAGLEARQAAARQAQTAYAADMAAYDQALATRKGAIAASDATYAKQKQAYAEAMAAWRAQVAECKDGDRAACSEKAPQIADYL
jgi:hypothetical protein